MNEAENDLDLMTTMSCKLKLRDYKRVIKFVPTKFRNKSSALVNLAMIGADVLDYKEMMKDPENVKEFTAKMQKHQEDETTTEHAATLTTQQLEGYIGMYKIELEGRYDQKRFR